MQQSISLKPQDIALLVKLLANPQESWRQAGIASEMGLSQGEIAKASSRLEKAGLLVGKRVNRSSALELLLHGIKYMFPVQLGPLVVGVPTALSAPAHRDMVVQGDDVYVWPSAYGKSRGQSILPFYPKLAEAALKDKFFYDLMSAIEILRVGRARERKMAEKYIERKISK